MFGSSFLAVFGNVFISKHYLERITIATIYTFPLCSFLSEVTFIYSEKRSKNLAMLEKYLSGIWFEE